MGDIIAGLERIVTSFENNPGIVDNSRIIEDAIECAETTQDTSPMVFVGVGLLVITVLAIIIIALLVFTLEKNLAVMLSFVIAVIYAVLVFILIRSVPMVVFDIEGCAQRFENAVEVSLTEAEIRISRAFCAYDPDCIMMVWWRWIG